MHAALFDQRACFNSIRRSFFENVPMHDARQAMKTTMAKLEEGSDSWTAVMLVGAMYENLRAHQQSLRRPAVCCEEELWQVYLRN
eukprot:6890483-Karenia_brevis.AAC.1